MKKLLLLVTIIFAINIFGQPPSKKSGGGSGGGGSSASSAPSSSQIQTGYSYVIKRRIFMKYIYHKMVVKKNVPAPIFIVISKTNSSPITDIELEKGSLIQLPEDNDPMIKMHRKSTIALRPGTIIELPTGVGPTLTMLSYQRATIGNKLEIIGGSIKTHSVSNTAAVQQDKGTPITIPVTQWIDDTRDTVMWVTDTVNVNAKYRLRVSVTQDSGDLKLNIKHIKRRFLLWHMNSKYHKALKASYTALQNSTIPNKDTSEFSVNNPPVYDITLTKSSYHEPNFKGREISTKDSIQNFHILIPQSNVIGDITYKRRLPYNMMQFGAMTIPLQYRPSYNSEYGTVPTNVSTSINVAGYWGWEWGWTKFYADPSNTHTGLSFITSVFAGPTSFTSLTAPTGTATISAPSGPGTNQIGITYGLSIALNYENFNFGLFGGMDTPLADGKTYFYENKPWIGLGIGFNLAMFVSGAISSQTAASGK